MELKEAKGSTPDPPIDLLDSCVNMINMIRHHVKPHVTKLQKCYKTKKMLQKLQNRINMIGEHVKPNVTKDQPTHTF